MHVYACVQLIEIFKKCALIELNEWQKLLQQRIGQRVLRQMHPSTKHSIELYLLNRYLLKFKSNI